MHQVQFKQLSLGWYSMDSCHHWSSMVQFFLLFALSSLVETSSFVWVTVISFFFHASLCGLVFFESLKSYKFKMYLVGWLQWYCSHLVLFFLVFDSFCLIYLVKPECMNIQIFYRYLHFYHQRYWYDHWLGVVLFTVFTFLIFPCHVAAKPSFFHYLPF